MAFDNSHVMRITAEARLGLLTTPTNNIFQFASPCNGSIIRVRAAVPGTAPTGGDLVFNIKNGVTSLWTLSADRLKIVSGAHSGEEEDIGGVGTSGAFSVSKDTVITVDATSVPSTVGDPLYLQIEFAETDVDTSGFILTTARTVEQALHDSNFARAITTTGIAPSATMNVYGATKGWASDQGAGLQDCQGMGPIAYLALTSGGVFGSETVTARITLAGVSVLTKTFVAAGVTTEITNEEIFNLIAGLGGSFSGNINTFDVDCQSDINSSTATVGFKVGFWGGFGVTTP